MSLQAFRDSREQCLILSRKDRARLVIAAVSGQVCDRRGKVKPRYRQWTFQGVPVCRRLWEYAHAVGHSRVDLAKHCLKVGADGPPDQLGRLPLKFNDADAWFLDLYQSLGEPLAEVDPSFIDVDCVPIDDADHPLWSLRIAINNGQYAPKAVFEPRRF